MNQLGSSVEMHAAVREIIFSQQSHASCWSDGLRIDRCAGHYRVIYQPANNAIAGSEPSWIDIRYHPQATEMWIAYLHISEDRRLQGWGKSLASVAEGIARLEALDYLYVYPLASSVTFWQKLGYSSSGITAGVLKKLLSPPT